MRFVSTCRWFFSFDEAEALVPLSLTIDAGRGNEETAADRQNSRRPVVAPRALGAPGDQIRQ